MHNGTHHHEPPLEDRASVRASPGQAALATSGGIAHTEDERGIAGTKFLEVDSRSVDNLSVDCSTRLERARLFDLERSSDAGSAASSSAKYSTAESGTRLPDADADFVDVTSLLEASIDCVQEFPLVVRHAVSGAVLTRVQVRNTDTVAHLREAVLRGNGEVGIIIRLLFESQVLDPCSTLEEVGIGFECGDVFAVLTPLRCLTVALDGTARIRHLHSGVQVLVDIGTRVWSSALSPQGSTLLMIDTSAEGSLWCAETGVPLCTLEEDILTCSFSADGRLFVGASDELTARIWCAESGECLCVLSGHSDDVKSAAFSPDGQLVATASSDGTSRLFDAARGTCHQVLMGHLDVVMSALFAPDGSTLATASMDCTARLWSTTSGECLRVLAGHGKAVEYAVFSPGGDQVLTTSFDGTLRVWHAASGENQLSLLGESTVVKSAAFSPDGAKVAMATGCQRVDLYDVQTGERCATMVGHEDWIRSVSFSEDGTVLSSASYDGTARVWSAATGECLQTLTGHVGAVICADLFEG